MAPRIQVDKTYGATRRAIAAGLERYNRASVGDGKARGFSVSVRDGKGAIRGGASVRVWHGWAFVDIVWIDEAFRGAGAGRRMMAAVEDEAARRGARGVHLNTHGWQARPFYEKCGYVPVGEIPDYPPGHSCFIMMKRF